MRTIILCFLLLPGLVSFSQDLKNTEWIEVSQQRPDGTGLINKLQPGGQPLKYFFYDNKVEIAFSNQYTLEEPYSVSDGVIHIGEFVKFKIDTLTEEYIVLTDMQRKGDTVQRALFNHTFLKTDYIFSYAKQTQQLRLMGDSMIEACNVFTPSYRGNLTKKFHDKFIYMTDNINLSGSFIIRHDGTIVNIEIADNRRISKADISDMKEIIRATQGAWILPPTPQPYSHLVKFTISFANIKPLRNTFFQFPADAKSKVLYSKRRVN